MKNKKWLIATVCMLLASSVILAGCMYAIAQQEEPSKPYEMGEAVSLVPEDAPTAQTEMEAKFAVYNHVLEVGEEKTLVLFSDEQATEQWAKRENGEDFRLTYDEIIFLINDSLRLYNTYDEIYLTDALKNGIFVTEMSGNDHVVNPDGSHFYLMDWVGLVGNKGETYDLTYDGEQAAYEKMLHDVMQIATYRVAMLDSRMRQIHVTSVPNSGLNGSFNSYSVGGKLLAEGQFPAGFPDYRAFACWAMLPVDEPVADENAYLDGFRFYFSCGLSETESESVENYPPMLLFGFEQSEIRRLDSLTEFVNYWQRSERLFPSAEMEEEGTAWELKGSYLEPTACEVYTFAGEGIWRGTKLHSFDETPTATYKELMGDLQAVVDRYQTAEVSYTAAEIGNRFFELKLGNGSSVLIPEKSLETEGEYGVACITKTANTYENLSFRPCLKQAFYLWTMHSVWPAALQVSDMTYRALELEYEPGFGLSIDGTGYLHAANFISHVQPIEYILEDGRLVLYSLDENGEEYFRAVFFSEDYGFVYSAEESTGEGMYAFPDGTVFYQVVWSVRPA